ncbi:PREDICTED: translation machinery-associated protein 16 isoform X2 [Dinoponera quadriceps]|nr:PREDICTED: translation machinery-associated protein 16 isoform X2 [Dinoponera quadriceps]
MIKQNLIGEKMMWIQQNMVPDLCPYTSELTAELLLKYIRRNDEELEQIGIKHSVGGKRGRQHASREDLLRMTKMKEQVEFDTCGIEIPDILIPTQCEMLRTWNGELKLLPRFKFRRFGKVHLKDMLQRKEKQSKIMNNPANCATLACVSKPTICSPKDSKVEDIKNSSVENKELNTTLSESTILNDCSMDME